MTQPDIPSVEIEVRRVAAPRRRHSLRIAPRRPDRAGWTDICQMRPSRSRRSAAGEVRTPTASHRRRRVVGTRAARSDGRCPDARKVGALLAGPGISPPSQNSAPQKSRARNAFSACSDARPFDAPQGRDDPILKGRQTVHSRPTRAVPPRPDRTPRRPPEPRRTARAGRTTHRPPILAAATPADAVH